MLAFTCLLTLVAGQAAKGRLQNTGKEATKATDKISKEYERMDAAMQKQTDDFVGVQQGELSTVNKDMKSNQDSQKKFASKEAAAISAVTKEAVDGQGSIQIATSDAKVAVEDLVGMMQTESDEFSGDIESKAEGQEEKTESETEKTIGQIEEMREQGNEGLAAAAEKVGEETDELNGKIKDETKEAEMVAKEQMNVQKEIMKQTNENNKNLAKTEKLVDKTVSKMESKLDSAATALDRMKTDAQKTAQTEAGRSMNIVQKEFNTVAKETEGELKEMRKSNEQLQKGLTTEINDAVKEGDANMNEVSKESQNTEKATNKQLDQAATALEKDDEKMESLQEKASDESSTQGEKLVEAENSLQQTFRKASAAATATRNNMVAATQHMMEQMKEGVQSTIKEQDSRVQAENSQRINTEMGEISQANKYVDSATVNLQEESARLEEEINNMKVEGQQASSGVEQLKGNIEQEEKRTEQMINEQKLESLESLKEGKANLQGEFEQAAGLVQQTAGSAKRNVEAELKSVEEEMGKKISDDLEARGQTALAGMQRTTAGIQTGAQELVTKMEGEQASIE